ncbi:MAG TPA: thioesterase domain-containing protein [Xanthobacteraceae bacterium]|jgi:medium-chain acyl-[acyl-carrier-protein] hydrolase
MTLEQWVPFRNESVDVRCRLFAFPHAGGSAAFYRPLRLSMPAEIDLCPIELPGRGARLGEPPLASMRAIVERLGELLQPLLMVPFGFFGHSVGAWTAYQAVRQLRSPQGRSAVHLFVSGRGSPERAGAEPRPARVRSDQELLAMLRRFGGTPAAVMQDAELTAALLPALRADLALADEYAADPADRMSCPITAFGGAEDDLHLDALRSWNGFTRGPFRLCTFPGGHFYFSPAPRALADEIFRDLRRAGQTRAAAAGAPS